MPFGIVGFSAASWSGFSLPLDLGLIGLPGCTLFVEVAVAETMVRTGTRADWTIDLPSDASLVGQDFWLQALVLDPMAHGGAALSNAGHGRICSR